MFFYTLHFSVILKAVVVTQLTVLFIRGINHLHCVKPYVQYVYSFFSLIYTKKSKYIYYLFLVHCFTSIIYFCLVVTC